MEGQLTFLDCPAYLGTHDAARCGLPAEVEAQYTIRSSDGLLEGARIRCPVGHWFNGAIESLAIPQRPAAQHSGAQVTGPTPEKIEPSQGS